MSPGAWRLVSVLCWLISLVIAFSLGVWWAINVPPLPFWVPSP